MPERFGQLLSDIDSAAAARAQVYFLKDAQIGIELAHLAFNVVQIFAAIDVPVEDGGAGPGTRVVRIVARNEGL